MKKYVIAGVVMGGMLGLAVMIASVLNLTGSKFGIFVALLGTIGAAAAGFIVFIQSKKEETKAAMAQDSGSGGGGGAANGGGGGEGSAELDALLRDAEARLMAAKAAGGAGIANLPVVLLIGDRGAAKTSTVLQSGLEAELLAGQLYQENAIAPTRTLNAWFAKGAAFLEAGGPLLADPGSWMRLIRKVKPGKLKSPAAKGQPAPRAVIVCFDGESFIRQGASEAVPAAVRYMQARLGEISEQLGISFPVYVLFTRMDKIPYFTDYVNNLSNEEGTQVVGVTLPIRVQTTGVYAEQETQRLTGAFNNLFHSLCDKRLEFLPRETDPAKVPGGYEFPREFRKLRTSVVQVLVDMCRPSQLRASPFLRGFYFSGVRPVVVSDMIASPAAKSGGQPVDPFSGATSVFRVGKQQEMIAQAAQAGAQPNAKRVPQWLFLGHFFNDILLQDRVAMSASGASIKSSFLKRVLFACAAGICLLYSIFLLVSFLGNRKLEDNANTAAQGITSTEAAGAAVPSEDSLKRLETLRQSLLQLTDYETNGAPLSMRWGLYSGSKIYPSVRKLYYNKFSQLLFGPTQAGMLGYLRKVPPSPGPTDDFGYPYNTLKGYLLTTSQYQRTSDKSLQQFLSDLLMDRWSAKREDEIGKDRMALARLQFDFYSRDLVNGNPFPTDAGTDADPAVKKAREYLSKFSGVDNKYQALLAEVNKGNPRQTFNGKFPGTGDTVTSSDPVQFAYTADGWDAVQKALKNSNISGEKWVLGDYAVATGDKAALDQGVQDRYTRDYIEQWRKVLKNAKVNAYGDLTDAAAKLNKLSSTQTALLNLFWWISLNTGNGPPKVADAFKVVYQVVPVPARNAPQQYIVLPNQAYIGGLSKLQQDVQAGAEAKPEPDANLNAAFKNDANAARQTTKQLSLTFPIDPEAHTETTSYNLLLEPIIGAEAAWNRGGAEAMNRAGAGFCSGFNAMKRKFPFKSDSKDDVTLDELGGLMNPKDGQLSQLIKNVSKAITCQGTQCTANPGATVQVNPAFLRSLSQMIGFSNAIYGPNGSEPNYKYSLKPQPSDLVDSFDIKVNDQSAKLKGGQQQAYTWPGPGTRAFHLTVKVTGGSSLDVETNEGLWAVFHFFADADKSSQSGAGYTFTWVVRTGRDNRPTMISGKPLTYQFDVDTGGAPAVFSKEFLAGLQCVPTVAH